MTQNSWPSPPKSPGSLTPRSIRERVALLGSGAEFLRSNPSSSLPQCWEFLCATTPVPFPHPLIPKEIFGIRSSSVLRRSAKTKKKGEGCSHPLVQFLPFPLIPSSCSSSSTQQPGKDRLEGKSFLFSSHYGLPGKGFFHLGFCHLIMRSLKSALTSEFNRGNDHPPKEQSRFP